MAFAVKVQSSPCSHLLHHVLVLNHGSKRNTTKCSRLSATPTLNECTRLHLQHKILKQAPSLELAQTGSYSRWSQGRTQMETPCNYLSTLSLNQRGKNYNPGTLTVPLGEEIKAGGYARGNFFVAFFFMLQTMLQTVLQTMLQTMRQAVDLISKLLLKHRLMHELILFCAMTSTGLYCGSYYVMRGCSVHGQLHSEYIQHLYAAVMAQTLVSKGIAV